MSLFSKAHKFAAKLVLLHYGQLVAVRDMDDATVPVVSGEGNDNDNNNGNDNDDDDDDDGGGLSKDANEEVIGIY